MDEAVEDRVPEGGVADQVVPVLDQDLAGDEGGALAGTILDDFEEVPSFAIAHGGEAPIVQDEQIGFGVLLEEAAIGAVPPRWARSPKSRGSRT